MAKSKSPSRLVKHFAHGTPQEEVASFTRWKSTVWRDATNAGMGPGCTDFLREKELLGWGIVQRWYQLAVDFGLPMDYGSGGNVLDVARRFEWYSAVGSLPEETGASVVEDGGDLPADASCAFSKDESALLRKHFGGKDPVSMLAAVEWVFENVDAPWIEVEDSPSLGAWSFLLWVHLVPVNRRDFYTTFVGKLLPSKAQLEEMERMKDDGADTLAIIDRLTRTLRYVEGSVLRVKTDENAARGA